MTTLILTTTALLVLAIWIWGIAGQSIRQWFQARRELRRDRRRRRAHEALIRDCFRESQEWEQRKLERERRFREREERRVA